MSGQRKLPDSECPLCNDERINLPRRHSNLKGVCVKAAKCMKQNTDGTEQRNRQVQNYSWRLQYLFLNKWQNN